MKKFFERKDIRKQMKSKKISTVTIRLSEEMEYTYVMRRAQTVWAFPADVYKHEKMRWETMTDEQLATRVRKITKPDKLACFMHFAEISGKKELLDLAERRKKSLELRRRIADGYRKDSR